jgi:tetratricopeptide (TPR) repeat protein
VPRPIADLLVTAVPELRDRLVEDRIRRAWAAVAGEDIARRTNPQRLVNGCLEVAVDNSPWLSELTLRSAELAKRVGARFDGVRSIRFVLGTIAVEPRDARPRAPRSVPLTAEVKQGIDDAVAVISDDTLRTAARRLMTKAHRARPLASLVAIGIAAALASGCAATRSISRTSAADDTRRMTAAPPTTAAQAYYHYSVAQLHAQGGRFKEAIAEVEQAIKLDPRSPYLWRDLAQWLARSDTPDQALAAARKAVELAPDQSSSHLTLAELLRTQKKYAEAEAELERVIALNPDSEDGYLTLARFFVEQKKYDRARTVLLRLVDKQPRLAQAQFLLGRLAVETEAWDEAITRLKKAVELDPDHDGAWTALGYAYESRHQHEAAIDVYRRAIKANPDNPAFVERLSDLLIRLGRFKEAQAEVEALADGSPRDARVWIKLGAVYYEQKLWDKAADAFRRAVQLEPTNLRARYFLATSLMDAGRDDDARAELERILKVDPRSVDARVQLGFLHGRAKRYDQAVAILRDAINLEPRRPELFLYLGSAYVRAKE